MQIGNNLIWHQVSTRTWYNRYLLEFLLCKELMDPKTILSFGCSTGEECATLHMHFPNATITGCDINPDVLRLAKERYPEYRFMLPPIAGAFDAIFAMNVFHRNTQNCDGLPAYNRGFFDAQIIQLQKLILHQGHLILYAAQYSEPQGFKLIKTFGKLDIYIKV